VWLSRFIVFIVAEVGSGGAARGKGSGVKEHDVFGWEHSIGTGILAQVFHVHRVVDKVRWRVMVAWVVLRLLWSLCLF
jgi:hypothetical protein